MHDIRVQKIAFRQNADIVSKVIAIDNNGADLQASITTWSPQTL